MVYACYSFIGLFGYFVNDLSFQIIFLRLWLNCFFKNYTVNFLNIYFEMLLLKLISIFLFFFNLFFGFSIWLPFDFNFVSVSIFFLKLLFVIFLFIESEKILYCLTFSNRWRQISETISKKYRISPIMKNIFSYHLLKRLFFHFFSI